MSSNSSATGASRWPRLPSPRMPQKRFLYSLFLFFLFIAYWVFVWQMERLTITPDQLPGPFDIPPALANATGIFHWRVLRHLWPVLLGALLAAEMAGNLAYHLYDLPDRAAARRFVRRLRDPRIGGGASATVTSKDLEAQRREKALLRVGGPGRVTIPPGQVGITEVNSGYLRTLNSGTYRLSRFERLHSVLDLRPQERTDPDVRLFSKEGLEVVTYLGLTFRISRGKSMVSAQQPFPFDPDAVRKLAYDQSNLPYSEAGEWEDTAVALAKSVLAEIVQGYSVQELLQEEESQLGAHLSIRRDAERQVSAKLAERDIELILMRIGRFRFPDDVTAQFIERWRGQQERHSQQASIEREAGAMAAMDIARAEAELAIVRAIAAGMAQARRQGYTGTFNDIMAVRFV